MAITTTCNHIVNSIDDVFDLQIKGYDDKGNRVVLYQCFCNQCAKEKELNNEIIYNQSDEISWLSGVSEDPQATLFTRAKDLTYHDDPVVSSFAASVLGYIETSINDNKIVTVRIDTNDDFTLSFKDVLITGVGKVILGSISEAITCLNSAHITWMKDPSTYDISEVFLQYCCDASTALRNGQTSFVKQDSTLMLTVEVRK